MTAYLGRREFVKVIGTATLGVSFLGFSRFSARGVAVVLHPDDSTASAGPVQWALGELESALRSHGVSVRRVARQSDASSEELVVVAAGASHSQTRQLLTQARATVPDAPEALALVPVQSQLLLATGTDVRGLVYALLELSDRVEHTGGADESLATLDLRSAVIERPANTVRSNQRLFTSDVHDKPWYNDREMWPAYLGMLAANRFNRFNLSLGIGYDFLRNVTDAYFLFAYPFLVDVPGYNVRATGLPNQERDRNLEMLRYISDLCAARGMEFQLGIWTHGHDWSTSPNPNHRIEGLTPDNHAQYCRDALAMILRECPSITGVNIRIHGESGVNEGSYSFWETVFDGVVRSGRTVEIEMHAKGIDDEMIHIALATGMPVKVSPKFWAEHLGMPYHQADIRGQEMPQPPRPGDTLMLLSNGTRRFMRYGYGDLLREDRTYGIIHRIWPGTQRLLLWGDPVSAAAYGRAFSFADTDGVEIMEPLSFKGRRGSGIPGDRAGYSDESLRTRWDWEKYLYGYRVWGRLIYNPETEPDVWQRFLRKEFQAAAPAVEQALGNASRILPIVTTAHGPSAANNSYWPEVYTNQSLVRGTGHPYSDTDNPRIFGNVSPFDPQLFARSNEFANELLAGQRSGKYTPIDVAHWLEDLADEAERQLNVAESNVPDARAPEYRRLDTDVAIQIGLGRFFAGKLRSSVLYHIYDATGDRSALQQAVDQYRRARASWAQIAEYGSVYVADITVGENPHLRGHWVDRLAAIDEDITELENLLQGPAEGQEHGSVDRAVIENAIRVALGRPEQLVVQCEHVVPSGFIPGRPLSLQMTIPQDQELSSIRLYYRHVNQVDEYESVDMVRQDDVTYLAVIPEHYTRSPYPLQYYFVFRRDGMTTALYPGFGPRLVDQPYLVVHHA